MFYEDTRPVPDVSRNLSCLLEYRPSPTDSTKPDILFIATASPYRLERVYMNPVDVFFHAIFAPGRHLTAPVRVVGATCQPPIWSKGRRIPQGLRPRGGLLCKRNELQRVVIEAETKHGQCRVEIPSGQSAPICREWLGKLGTEFQRVLDEPCREPHNRAARSFSWTTTGGKVQQLLEYSLVDSDNTSSDKLLELLGGPAVLTERMQGLGFQGIAVRAPTKAMASSGELANEATAEALANLLASLQQGDTLQPPQRDLLWGLMGRSRTGQRRIRARLPAGTAVLDKTGTGENGTVTNDVGVVTLPGGGGHLAIAVLIAASPLSTGEREDLIAEIALVAFNEFASST